MYLLLYFYLGTNVKENSYFCHLHMEKTQKKQKTIAVFDFDGTLINRDSLPDFLIRTFGWPAFLIRLPLILAMKIVAICHILPVHTAKEKIFTSFFRNMKTEDFATACKQYALRIPRLVYPTALNEIQNHLDTGHEVIIISASVPDWIRPWAETKGIHTVEGTELEIKNGVLTGCFATPNCKGEEKVRRLRKLFPDISTHTLYVYGDSSGDCELLALADVPFYKPFRDNR